MPSQPLHAIIIGHALTDNATKNVLEFNGKITSSVRASAGNLLWPNFRRYDLSRSCGNISGAAAAWRSSASRWATAITTPKVGKSSIMASDQSVVADGPLGWDTIARPGVAARTSTFRPASPAAPVSAAVQVSRLPENVVRASPSERCSSGALATTRPWQDGSLGRARRGTRREDLRRTKAGSPACRVGTRDNGWRCVLSVCTTSSRSRAIVCSSKREPCTPSARDC